MLELSTPEILALMGRVGDVQWESPFGVLLENGFIVAQLCNELEDLLGFNTAAGHSILNYSVLQLPF